MLKQMIALTALMVSSIAFAQDREYVIVVHGGAGAMAGLEEDPVKSAQYYAALDSALMIGDKVLSAGGEGPEAGLWPSLITSREIRCLTPELVLPVRRRELLSWTLPSWKARI